MQYQDVRVEACISTYCNGRDAELEARASTSVQYQDVRFEARVSISLQSQDAEPEACVWQSSEPASSMVRSRHPKREARSPRFHYREALLLGYNCPHYWVNYCPRNEGS